MKTLAVIDILGQEYKVIENSPDEDPKLKDADGYMDHSVHEIVIFDGTVQHPEKAIKNMQVYKEKVLRHEIVHAFLYESGLQDSSVWNDEHQEQMVDWFAIQLPKIINVLIELKAADFKRCMRNTKKQDYPEEAFKEFFMKNGNVKR